MSRQFDLEEILKGNPHIDREELGATLALLEEMRARGVRRKGYDLVPPFGGRRASARDDSREEPRPLPARRGSQR